MNSLAMFAADGGAIVGESPLPAELAALIWLPLVVLTLVCGLLLLWRIRADAPDAPPGPDLVPTLRLRLDPPGNVSHFTC